MSNDRIRERLPAEDFDLISSRLDLAVYEPVDFFSAVKSYTVPDGKYVLSIIEYLYRRFGRQSYSPQFYLGSLLNGLSLGWTELRSVNEVAAGHQMVRRLIGDGAYLHCVDGSGRTPLQNIALRIRCDEDKNVIPKWLAMLQDCGVDIDRYVYDESLINARPFTPYLHRYRGKFFSCLRPRKLYFTCGLSSRIRVEIKPWVDPRKPAALLLRELEIFPDMFLCPLPCSALENCAKHGPRTCEWPSVDSIFVELKSALKVNPDGKSDQSADTSTSHVRSGELTDTQSSELSGDEAPIWGLLEGDHVRQAASGDKCPDFAARMDLWPFCGSVHTLCGTGNFLGQGCINFFNHMCYTDNCTICQRYTCNYNHKRFWRKQEKQIAKRRRIEGAGLG